MPRLLLVGPPDADRLVPDDKRSFVRHLSLEECPAATLDDILVAVVTSDSAEVLLRTIQGLHRRVPEARIAAVAAPDVVRRLAALLRLAPDVPVDLETWADDQADLPDRVRALHDAAARTVAHQRSLAAIGGRDAARPVPLVRVTLDAVLEHAPFGALVVDDQHRLLAWNPAASDLLQLEARHDGASLRSVFLSADPVVEVATAAFGPGPASGSGRVVTVLGPDGVRLDISASPTHVADGREAVLVIVQDATARHTAEAARDKLSAQVELIGQVSEALLLASDDQDALQRVMLQVVPALADWVEIQVYDDRAVTERVVALHSDPSLAELTRSVEQALAGGLSADSPSRRIARGEGPILLPEITPSMLDRFVDDPHVRRLLEQLGVTSAVAVPLPGRTTLMGSLVLLTRGDSPLLGEQELSVAVEIGRRVGLSLENLQMQSRQRALAEALQRSMLTDPRQPDGAQIEVRYRPAAGEAQVGGDWYDSFVQPGGSVVLSVGDVMGHDSRAAAAMGQLRGVLRGIAYASPRTPGPVLSALDAAIDGLLAGTTATAVVAEVTLPSSVDPSCGVVWSNAGHPPPLLRRAGGGVQVLADGDADLLLGVEADTPRREHHVSVQPGDTLVLYSDGLVEQRGKDFDEGIRQLTDLLTAHGELPLGELCDAVLDELLEEHHEDDVVIVALRLDA